MKKYEVVIHRIDGKYINEYYVRNKNSLNYITKEDFYKEANGDYSIYELTHNSSYEKIKSPYKDEKGNDIYLYGRYTNISSRLSEFEARF